MLMCKLDLEPVYFSFANAVVELLFIIPNESIVYTVTTCFKSHFASVPPSPKFNIFSLFSSKYDY